MKTIVQLANIARRSSRLAKRALKKLTRRGSKLTDSQVAHYRAVLANTPRIATMLQAELFRRRIGLPGLRNATPHKRRRMLEARLLAGQPLAAAA